MRTWIDKDTGASICEPDHAEEWLQFMQAVGGAYDGQTTVKGLKALIDELVEMSKEARKCMFEGRIFSDSF